MSQECSTGCGESVNSYIPLIEIGTSLIGSYAERTAPRRPIIAFVVVVVNGGAGHTMFKDAKVLYRSSKDLRELIVDWVKRSRHVPTTPANNWRLLPEPK